MSERSTTNISYEIDYEKAQLDPASVFDGPESVLTVPGLSRERKIEILKRWEYDASELEVAEEEGMGGGEKSMLGRVLKALAALSAEVDVGHSPPTKQGGV